MRMSDWSSDVCSSGLADRDFEGIAVGAEVPARDLQPRLAGFAIQARREIGIDGEGGDLLLDLDRFLAVSPLDQVGEGAAMAPDLVPDAGDGGADVDFGPAERRCRAILDGDPQKDRQSKRLNSSHLCAARMASSGC